MSFKLIDVEIKNFRSFYDVKFKIGKKITVISGQNGVGKSNLVSLISSGSGLSKRANFGGNFQPEFYDYFYVDPKENFLNYSLFLTYQHVESNSKIEKKLSFKDDTKSGRGIRVIPRISNHGNLHKTQKEAIAYAKKFGVKPAARIPIPTIYLSMSRLYPLGERKESVTITAISRRNKLYLNEVDVKFKEWYNRVIPGSICKEGELSLVDKNFSARASLHMDMERTPTLSQSVGQDNVGNIVSALLDVYILSKQEGYEGAIVCIDEIEVSLHPDTQLRLLSLFDELTESLGIQFIVSTHSLTILKEILQKQKRNDDNYSVVYLKNPSHPFVTEQRDYLLLKADLFNQMTFDRPVPKVYFEDEVTQHVFKLLVQSLFHQSEVLKSGGKLRQSSDEKTISKINQRLIESANFFSNIGQKLKPIVIELGCEELIKIADRDASYFNRVIFLLDGDARVKDPADKICVRDYLSREVDTRGKSDRKHPINVCFLPTYFAPESYLYRIIYQLINEQWTHSVFWRTLDQHEETVLFNADRIKEQFNSLSDKFDNDELKRIFKEYKPNELNSEIWRFIDKSRLLDYYYGSYKTVVELLDFFDVFKKAYTAANAKTLANRFG